MNKFKNYTANLLMQAYNMNTANRSVWAPSCPFHCFSRFGEVDDPRSINFTAPGNTSQTLGITSHWFIFENLTGAFIDTVDWPGNKLCSNQSLDD